MKRAIPYAIASLLGTSSLVAQTTSSTPPIGFIRKDCPANSDTRISIPLERQAVFIGPLLSVADNVLTVQGSPAWTTNEFQQNPGTQDDAFYVLFLSGSHMGRAYDVTANGANTLTIELGPDDLDGVGAGDRIKLLPHWNLKTAFPEGSGVAASSNPFSRETELLVQDAQSAGINLASVKTFYYSDSWKDISDVNGDAGTEVIPPHRHLVVRNKEAATSAVFVGVVPSDTQAVPIRVPAGNGKQDNPVSLIRPVPVKLRDAGLDDDAVFKPSTLPVLRTDELLVYDDTEAAVNKSAKYTYYRWDGAWRRLDQDASYDAGDDIIFTPGSGVVIRKSGNGGVSEERIYWNHEDPTQ